MLATLAQAMSSTKATAQVSSRRRGRTSSTTDAASDTTSTVQPRLVSGNCCARRPASAFISVAARSWLTPGFSRPSAAR